MAVGKLVLVADDHEDSRCVLRAVLEHCGWAVIEVENGQECVRAAFEHRPAVIFMDLRMPLLDGWDATALIKADPETAATPIVAVTASAFAEDAGRALRAGCVRVLVKPVIVQDLVATLAELGSGPALPPLPAD